MDSAPYLQAEDKPDFERILEELLHDDEVRLALRRAPGGPNAEQLHTRAISDFADISANASAEYAYYRELRDHVRSSAPTPDWERLGGDDPAQWHAPDNPLDAAEGAGWVPLIAVLLPILSGLGAIVMLLLGYTFRANHLSLGQPLVTAGFVSAVVCAAAIAVDIIGLLLTAARDAASPPDGRSPELYAELAKARDTWRTALRENALRPYLLAQLGAPQRITAGAGAGYRRPAARPAGVSLVRARPKLGYSSPGFTSPGPERITDEVGHELEADPDAEPHFSSPGFTSPGAERISGARGQDLEADPDAEPHFSSPGFTSPGPEGITDERGQEAGPVPESESHFSSPGYSRPDYSSPDFSSPAFTSREGVPAPRGTAARSRSRFLPNADDADVQSAADAGVDNQAERD